MEPEGDLPSQQPSRRIAAAFGLVPLVVPYEDSPPELRLLNIISAGLLYEGRNRNAEELGMTKIEFTRALRALRESKSIYVDSSGRYRLGFRISNFPNIAAK